MKINMTIIYYVVMILLFILWTSLCYEAGRKKGLEDKMEFIESIEKNYSKLFKEAMTELNDLESKVFTKCFTESSDKCLELTNKFINGLSTGLNELMDKKLKEKKK